MAWIAFHDTVREHCKTYQLADALKIPNAYAAGLLACLWAWAATYALDGDLTRFPPRAVERAAGWEGRQGKLYAALIQTGWIDEVDGRVMIHDWEEYTQLYQDKVDEVRRQTKQRVNQYRERKKAQQAAQCNAQNGADSQSGNGGVTDEGKGKNQTCNAACNVTGNVTSNAKCNAGNAPTLHNNNINLLPTPTPPLCGGEGNGRVSEQAGPALEEDDPGWLSLSTQVAKVGIYCPVASADESKLWGLYVKYPRDLLDQALAQMVGTAKEKRTLLYLAGILRRMEADKQAPAKAPGKTPEQETRERLARLRAERAEAVPAPPPPPLEVLRDG